MKRNKGAEAVESASVGIVIGEREVYVVARDTETTEPTQHPRILAWEAFPYESFGDIRTGLARFVSDHGLQEAGCRCVLPRDLYSLRLVERPANVPDEDLADATRWLVRDLIEFDVESAELTILTLPDEVTRARTPKMFVVAARHEEVLDIALAIQGSELRLMGFETLESTLLALEEQRPEIVTSGAMLLLDQKASILTLSRDAHLYLARNLNVDITSIDEAANLALIEEDPTGPRIIEGLDPLLLDIQRSLDYYESEYGLAPASRLSILPGELDLSPILPALSEALRPLQVECIEVEQNFTFATPPPLDLQQAMLVAAAATTPEANVLDTGLLPASFQPKDGDFGLGSVARGLAAILALSIAYYGFARYQLEGQAEALATLEAQRDAIAEEIDVFREDAAVAAASADPEAEIAALTSLRDSRRSIIEDMTNRAAQTDASFSKLFEGLAHQNTDGVWLEHIEFADGGDSILLEGRSVSADDVPAYLRALGSEPSFSGRQFQAFQMGRSLTDSTLSFRIATRDRSQVADEEASP